MSEPGAVTQERRCDVAIVGAGPAGLAALNLLRDHGLAIAVIDEQPRAGGQLLRQPPDGVTVDGWLAAPLYKRAKAALAAVDRSAAADWLFGATVLGIERTADGASRTGRFRLWIQQDSGCRTLSASVVLLAPGCHEQPFALPGWTLPGVMGAGAIQAFVKSQQLMPGERFLFAGNHPLQLLVADQLVAGGGHVLAVVFSQRRRQAAGLLRYPRAVMQNLPPLAETARILVRLRRAGVRVLFGRAVTAIAGDRAVEQATVSRMTPDGQAVPGDAETIRCDRVGLCHAFVASSELARQLRADGRHVPHRGGWLVSHDAAFESSVAGLFVAGEITGLAGADASLEEGRIAAAGILQTLRGTVGDAVREAERDARGKLASINRFAAMLNHLSRPPPQLARALATADTVICRCEGVTHGELQRALNSHPHIASADAAKLCTRAGMGLCQGRFCSAAVMRAVAAARHMALADTGGFRIQFPVKPANIGQLCGLADKPGDGQSAADPD